jgi:endoglucanase
MTDLYVDVGLPEERINELVTIGDTITIARKVVNLKGGLVAGKAFDDRAAVVTVIEAMRQLQDLAHTWDVYAIANVQEEDGAFFAGATTTTFEIHPDIAVALDVNHADQPGVSEPNVTPLREGPGIARGPNIHPLVHERLVATAAENEIPHRVTVYPGATGTNAWAMQIVAEGIPTGLIDLPLRYMHTSVETLCLDDLERSARLLAHFAASLDEQVASALRGQMIDVASAPVKTVRTRKKRKTRGRKR